MNTHVFTLTRVHHPSFTWNYVNKRSLLHKFYCCTINFILIRLNHQIKVNNILTRVMSGVSLAVGPRTDVDKTSSSGKGRWSGMTTAVGGGGLRGSLRVIELQLVAFILVFSASGLVPLLDMLFPAFASVYIIALSRLAFPSHGVSTASPELFHGSKLFRFQIHHKKTKKIYYLLPINCNITVSDFIFCLL